MAVQKIEAATAGCGFDEEEALLPAHDSACGSTEAALRRMLLAPVPDLTGFAAKLELFFEHEIEPHSVDRDPQAVLEIGPRR